MNKSNIKNKSKTIKIACFVILGYPLGHLFQNLIKRLEQTLKTMDTPGLTKFGVAKLCFNLAHGFNRGTETQMDFNRFIGL